MAQLMSGLGLTPRLFHVDCPSAKVFLSGALDALAAGAAGTERRSCRSIAGPLARIAG